MSSSLSGRSALVIGGTAGIGEAVAVELATRGAAVTVAGRNAEAGAAVVSRMRSAAADPGASFDFLRLDASSLNAVRAFTTEVRERRGDQPLDYLVMCHATASFGGRQETSEGFELKLVLHAYSRFLLTEDLLPILRPGRRIGRMNILREADRPHEHPARA